MKSVASLLGAALLAVGLPAASAPPDWNADPGAAPLGKRVTVHYSPSCGCCKHWMAHLERHGFIVERKASGDVAAIKRDAGLKAGETSCHTAFVDGYVIEGHVPARDIKRLLEVRSDVRGLAVPDMPVGSPGMEMGTRRDAFDVKQLNRDGTTAVWERYPGN